jgi:hypothetical protein
VMRRATVVLPAPVPPAIPITNDGMVMTVALAGSGLNVPFRLAAAGGETQTTAGAVRDTDSQSSDGRDNLSR